MGYNYLKNKVVKNNQYLSFSIHYKMPILYG